MDPRIKSEPLSPRSDYAPSEARQVPNSSLSVLLGGSLYSNQSPSPSPVTPVDRQPSKIAKDLEKICCAVIECVNARAWEQLASISAQHFRPDFKSSLDNARCCSTMAEFIESWRRLINQDQGYHCTVKHISVDVHEEFGHANAYMTLELTGIPADVVLLSLCVLRWRRRESRWIAYQCEVIRGMGGVAIGE